MSASKRKLNDNNPKILKYFNKDSSVSKNLDSKQSGSSLKVPIRDILSSKYDSNTDIIDKETVRSDNEFWNTTMKFSNVIRSNLNISWKTLKRENLNLKYGRLFPKAASDEIFKRLENEVTYFSGDLLKVKVFGKVHNIPRKQVSYGDEGLSYSFSGVCIPAVPWSNCPIVFELKKNVEAVTGELFNFVLINRYKDGEDHMGEHRDDEKDLFDKAPIASLSFGQNRDFVFKHKDSRGKQASRNIPPVTLELEHGSILLMEYPTNKFWYHSLPIRKKAVNARVNLTFRRMVLK